MFVSDITVVCAILIGTYAAKFTWKPEENHRLAAGLHPAEHLAGAVFVTHLFPLKPTRNRAQARPRSALNCHSFLCSSAFLTSFAPLCFLGLPAFFPYNLSSWSCNSVAVRESAKIFHFASTFWPFDRLAHFECASCERVVCRRISRC